MISKLIAKYLGPTFISRVATTAVGLLVAYLSKLGLEIPEEVVTQFSESSIEIVSHLLGFFVAVMFDVKFSKSSEKK